MSKKAAAFKEYREAAMVDMLLNTLPKVKQKKNGFNGAFIIYFLHPGIGWSVDDSCPLSPSRSNPVLSR